MAGLQPAFHINHLLELQESFQKIENPATLERAVATEVNLIKAARYCFSHEGKELELYCETCEELICYKCVIKGGEHHDHDYEELDHAFEKYKQEITSSLEPMERQVTAIKKILTRMHECCGEISDQRAATADSIHVTFERLREVLNVRETDLIGQLDQVTQKKLKGLAVQRDLIETTLAQLHSCLYFMRESLRSGSEDDVLLMKANTMTQVRELTTPLQADMLEPNITADMVFSASVEMVALCQTYGQVLSAGLPDPTKCHVTGTGAVVSVGERYTVVLQAMNFEGKPCHVPITVLECKLVSEITGTRSSCSAERRGQSQYEISYKPTIKGRHLLHIEAEGQHIRGSPHSVAVRMPVDKLGTSVLTIEGLARPWGVAVNQRGEVVVTEQDRHRVSVFSPNGEKICSFGVHGSGQGQLSHPHGVAVDGEGNILVADSWNYRIQKFTAEGQFITAVGTEGKGPPQFHGIAFNASNNMVYVTDRDNHRIHILNSDLTISSTFGSGGRGQGQFVYPSCIGCDGTGNVYVTDTKNCNIQVFTSEGKFLRRFGKRGQQEGELERPIGVAIDTSGMVYVSEHGNHRVSVFTSDGQFVTSFGRRGKGQGELQWPHGVAIDTCGVVYVCDSSSVQLF